MTGLDLKLWKAVSPFHTHKLCNFQKNIKHT